MDEKTKDFTTRSVSGLVYILLIVGALLYKNGIFFFLVFGSLSVVSVWEFNRISRVARTHPIRIILDCFAVLWLIAMGFLISTNSSFGLTIGIPLIFYLLFILSRSIFADQGHELERIYNSLFPLLYIGVPFFLATLISYKTSFLYYHFQGKVVLSIFMVVWANDTGAYIIGTWLGKHKLLPRLSPKKSVEGFLGGLFLSVVMAMILPIIFPNIFGEFSYWLMFIYGLLISLFATIGDLFESMLKRNAGIKDSGKIIPGHGGILDRIDSFLFAMPVVFIFITAFLTI